MFNRRFTAITTLISIFIFALSANVLPAALVRAAKEFNISPESLSSAGAIQFFGFFVASIFGAILSDYFGKKWIFIIACLLMGIGGICWSLGQSLTAVYIAGLVMGMGGGIIESMSSALLVDLYPERRKRYLNLSQILFCVGAIAGPMLMGYFMPRGLDWRIPFAIIGALSILLAIPFGLSPMPKIAHEDKISLAHLKTVLPRWSFIIPAAFLFLYVLLEFCAVFFCNLYLFKYRNAPEEWAIYTISGFWLTMGVGRWFCSLLPEETRYEYVIAGLFAASGVAMLMQGVVESWQASFFLFLLLGLFYAGTWPLIVGLATIRNPRFSGTVVGVTVAVGALGCVTAPSLMQLLLARVSPLHVFPLLSVGAFFGTGAMLLFARTHSPDAEITATGNDTTE